MNTAITVVMRRETLSNHPWLDCRWLCHAVLLGGHPMSGSQLQVDAHNQLFFWPLTLELWADESESYYHNLHSAKPSLFIAAPPDDNQNPQPQIITACGHLASSWGEMDMPNYRADLPPELGIWISEFVQTHYRPEPRKKRERESWK